MQETQKSVTSATDETQVTTESEENETVKQQSGTVTESTKECGKTPEKGNARLVEGERSAGPDRSTLIVSMNQVPKVPSTVRSDRQSEVESDESKSTEEGSEYSVKSPRTLGATSGVDTTTTTSRDEKTETYGKG